MLRALLLALVSTAIQGQVIDASKVGESVALAGDCRFQAGDDLRWTRPDFNDAGWRQITSEKSWRRQGLGAVRGFYWYRFRMQTPSTEEKLSLLVDEAGPYEVFADGQRIGGISRFSPDPVLTSIVPVAYNLPPKKGGVMVIALRAWAPPQAFRWNGLNDTLQVGTEAAVRAEVERRVQSSVISQIPDYVVGLAMAIICGGLILLFCLQRDHVEYGVLAAVLLAELATTVIEDRIGFFPTTVVGYQYPLVLLTAIYQAGLIEFVFRFLREPVPLWMRAYQGILLLPLLATVAFWSGKLSSPTLNTTGTLVAAPFAVMVPGLLLWRFARGNREAGWLAIPLCLVCLNDFFGTLAWSLYELHLRPTSDPIVPSFEFGMLEIDPDNVFLFLFLLSVAALILYRFQRIRSEQARASAELEAARTMQEVMVPRYTSLPGFRIESAYFPAQEVGGDFFQLFPSEADGSLLVIIGDVSGKGLKSAMLVSMIVGLLRSSTDQTRSPVRILEDLNRLLLGQTDGKFATCCCVLLKPSGEFLGANAGHLSPYCDGVEIELPGGIPLGLADDAEYEELRLDVPPGRRWVFLSDGVIEARSKSGELYGFDRTRGISAETVAVIAETARRFGQEDDITVLGVEPLAVTFG